VTIEFLSIEGGRPLSGVVPIEGAKNAALPACVASLLTDEPVVLHRVPELRDVSTILFTLSELGKRVVRRETSAVMTSDRALVPAANAYAVRQMRASFLVLGPLVARVGRACVPLPGGCQLGARPVDLHLMALRALGADIQERDGAVYASADRLRGARIELPFPSVGATEQVLMAASLAEGVTTLLNAAVEPEVMDLIDLLRRMGSAIDVSDREMRIVGSTHLHGAEHTLIPDRQEAGTYLLAGVATRGRVTVAGVDSAMLAGFLDALRETGADVRCGQDGITAEVRGALRPAHIATAPHPGFPTDLQPQFASHLCLAPGTSSIEERIFEGRFAYVRSLCEMGAKITAAGRRVTVVGVRRLRGADVEAPDIRAGAALVIAGLAASGASAVGGMEQIDRGYARIEAKLRAIGGRIERRSR